VGGVVVTARRAAAAAWAVARRPMQQRSWPQHLCPFPSLLSERAKSLACLHKL